MCARPVAWARHTSSRIPLKMPGRLPGLQCPVIPGAAGFTVGATHGSCTASGCTGGLVYNSATNACDQVRQPLHSSTWPSLPSRRPAATACACCLHACGSALHIAWGSHHSADAPSVEWAVTAHLPCLQPPAPEPCSIDSCTGYAASEAHGDCTCTGCQQSFRLNSETNRCDAVSSHCCAQRLVGCGVQPRGARQVARSRVCPLLAECAAGWQRCAEGLPTGSG